MEASLSSRERVIALAALGLTLLLRAVCILHFRFDSDESQHLHVVWGWMRGLLPYRDFFDNHTPVFHVLMTPLLALVGERADALFFMRAAMVPLYLLVLWCTYAIGRHVFSPRVGLWAAVLTAVDYGFFFISLEFRTDDLWAALWLVALVILVSGPLTAGRMFLTGLTLGTAVGVSQKTALLIAALLAAAGLVAILSREARQRLSPRRLGRLAGAALAGLLLVPLLLLAFFAGHGVLERFLYCTVWHNFVPSLGPRGVSWRPTLFPIGMSLVLWLAARYLRLAGGDRRRLRRAFLLLTATTYMLALQSFWPLLTTQDLMPYEPMAMILIAAALQTWEQRRMAGGTTDLRRWPLPAVVLFGLISSQLAVIVFRGPIWSDRTTEQTTLLADALRLTTREDSIADAKGETVFRDRAFYWVLESITRERMRRGLIPDTLVEDLEAKPCYVAVEDGPRFTPRTRAFMNENYLAVGRLRAAGRFLCRERDDPRPIAFDVVLPGRYALVARSGPILGRLDGTDYSGPRLLAAGSHEFFPVRPGTVALLWAQAAERGFTPFAAGKGLS